MKKTWKFLFNFYYYFFIKRKHREVGKYFGSVVVSYMPFLVLIAQFVNYIGMNELV